MTFDVSSVKPARDVKSRGTIRRLNIGIVSVSSMTVNDMIELFYHVRPYQISGGPDWIDRDRFDVTGKDSGFNATSQKPNPEIMSEAINADDEQMRELLKERFGLRLHHEVKTLPTLVLLANPKKRFLPTACSSEYRLQHGMVKGAIQIASLAALLKAELGMPVRDSSGLKGCYFIETRWTTDPADETLPSIPTALHELGFRLEKSKGDIDVLIIDHLERPKPD